MACWCTFVAEAGGTRGVIVVLLLKSPAQVLQNRGFRMDTNYVPILGKMTRAFSQDSRISEFFGSPDFGAYRKRNSSTPVSGKAHCGEELTQREIAMLRLIAAGFQNKEIAARECVSLNTVKTHNRHIFDKLDVRTRVQAIRRAQDLRLLGNS
jgi:DNA-binding CsgD family transcriptional regulator